MEDKAESKNSYSQKEKNEILQKLDDQRRQRQKNDAKHLEKYGNRVVYELENSEFFKVLGMGRDYFIRVDDFLHKDPRPEMVTLYYRGFDALRQMKVLVKFEGDTNKIFISEDPLRVYFKPTMLEELE
jgi:hypothetical protein